MRVYAQISDLQFISLPAEVGEFLLYIMLNTIIVNSHNSKSLAWNWQMCLIELYISIFKFLTGRTLALYFWLLSFFIIINLSKEKLPW